MFLDEFTDAGQTGFLTVLRANQGRPVVGWVTKSTVLVMMHYYRGRSLPCVSSDEQPCCLCERQNPVRLYIYLGLLTGQGTTGIVEMTGTCFQTFRGLISNPPPLHIPRLKVFRGNGKKNAPLSCEVDFKPCSMTEWETFQRKTPDHDLIKRSLTRLWELPHWPLGMNESDYDAVAASYIREIVANKILEG